MKEIAYSNCIIRIHTPDLTDEEHEKRLNAFKIATMRFLEQVEIEKRKGKDK